MPDTPTRPFAVVTGGSNGIGYELARQFVENGYDVLIAAQDAGHLTEAAGRLSAAGTQVTTHASDLSREDGVDSLVAAIRTTDRPVDTLCVNAGVGLGGAFVETDLKRELAMIDLNVRGAVQLTKPGGAGDGRARQRQDPVHLVNRLVDAGPVRGGLRRQQGVPALVRRGAAQ